MIPFDTLYVQNHEISELSKVLVVLIHDREICDAKVTCELFDRYKEKVKTHLDMEDKTMYSPLLSSADNRMNALASRFLNSAKEIKRLFNNYMNKWCHNGLHIYNHDQFVSETEAIFRMIQERIQAETEELYPAVRAVVEQHPSVAAS